MQNTEIKNLINKNYKFIVCLTPDKKYTKLTLKTLLKNKENNIIYTFYYNHVKKFLSSSQLENIDLYNNVKNLQFNDKLALNIASKKLTATEYQIKQIILLQSMREIKYLEL